jgi:hypothetical protein
VDVFGKCIVLRADKRRNEEPLNGESLSAGIEATIGCKVKRNELEVAAPVDTIFSTPPFAVVVPSIF